MDKEIRLCMLPCPHSGFFYSLLTPSRVIVKINDLAATFVKDERTVILPLLNVLWPWTSQRLLMLRTPVESPRAPAAAYRETYS